ncbi:hypothetical protein MIMGU_mgv1a022498mg [Erythranthe guttata]|uniref:Serpin domain-containing protein n=1 Tax=Erythranthe guttata TaxID=4155 RepID=A0A022QZ95_ERYGU|nr:hypothetical protein MIMGU_mgv1a022498mg [Erythranthe guttata]
MVNSFSSKLVTHVLSDGGPLGGPSFSTANGVWVDQSLRFKPTFREINPYANLIRLHVVGRGIYVIRCNFSVYTNIIGAEEVRKEVNAWAEKEKTYGLIKEIVLTSGSVDSTTRLILANAIYFKGVWQEKFDASTTRDRDFFLLNGSSTQATFVTSWKRQYIRDFDGFKFLKLPYKQGDDRERKFSMYLFFPDAKDGLPALMEKNSALNLDSSKTTSHKLYWWTRLFDGKLLYVSRIFHKSFIEVNEGGHPFLEEEKRVDFVADHPFLFAVREDISGAVLVIDQLLNRPLANFFKNKMFIAFFMSVFFLK